MNKRPMRSMRRMRPGAMRPAGTSASTPSVQMRPGSMLMRKIQRQLSVSVSQPPSVGPMVGASVTSSATATVTCVW